MSPKKSVSRVHALYSMFPTYTNARDDKLITHGQTISLEFCNTTDYRNSHLHNIHISFIHHFFIQWVFVECWWMCLCVLSIWDRLWVCVCVGLCVRGSRCIFFVPESLTYSLFREISNLVLGLSLILPFSGIGKRRSWGKWGRGNHAWQVSETPLILLHRGWQSVAMPTSLLV